MLHASDNKFNKKVYLTLFNDCERFPQKKNWCSLLRDLLCTLGFYEVWLFQDVGNEKLFLSNVKQRLKDIFIQNWSGRFYNSSRALFYRNIACFKFQPYLDICSVNKFRFSLSKLRMSAHRLSIESGRWARPNPIPIDLRKCNNCNVLEDEFHFVLECNMYTDLRCMYIPLYYRRRPNMQKFVQLATSEKETIVKQLGIYVYKAFLVRSADNYTQ